MAVPTFSWNSITAEQTNADSIVDEVLMEAFRQNQIHIEEWLGDGYTAAKDHDHDGINSALPASNTVGDSALDYTNLDETGTTLLGAGLTHTFGAQILTTSTFDSANGQYEVRVSTGSWRTFTSERGIGTVFSNGGNVRLVSTDGAGQNLYWASVN